VFAAMPTATSSTSASTVEAAASGPDLVGSAGSTDATTLFPAIFADASL
jgi:hypothetical protein